MRLDHIPRPIWGIVLIALLVGTPFAARADSDFEEDMEWLVDKLDRHDDRASWSWNDDDPCVLVQTIKDSDGTPMRRITFSLADIGQVETGRLRINIEMRGARAEVEDLETGRVIKTTAVEVRLNHDDVRDDLEDALDELAEECIDKAH